MAEFLVGFYIAGNALFRRDIPIYIRDPTSMKNILMGTDDTRCLVYIPRDTLEETTYESTSPTNYNHSPTSLSSLTLCAYIQN